MILKPMLPIFVIVPLTLGLVFLCLFRVKKISVRVARRLLMVLCLLLLLLRPMVVGGEVETENLNLDIVFVLDSTLSMAAEDYAGEETRMEAAKVDMMNVIDEFRNARYALVTYDNYPRVVMPLSSDVASLKREIRALAPANSYYARGTSMNDVIEVAGELLASVRKLQEETEGKERKTVLLFLGDGELTRDEQLASFADLKQYVDGGYVLGYGTERGGKMKGDKKNDYYVDAAGYVLDNTVGNFGALAVSKIDEGNLKKIATEMGLEYLHAENHAEVKKAMEGIGGMAAVDTDSAEGATDLYYILVILMVGLLMWEFVDDKGNII